MIRRIWDITLTVKDLKRAANFYEDILGLQKKYEFGDYAAFDCGGIEVGLKTWGDLEEPRRGEPCMNFQVDDIEESFRVLREKGVEIPKGVEETMWGARKILFKDPDGNLLQFSEVDWKKYFEICSPK